MGGARTNLNTGEVDYFAILPDDERASRALVVQHTPGLEDLQILIANVLDRGDDPEFGYGGDFVDGTRKRNFKTTNGAGRGLGVSTDGRESNNGERERNHVEVSG